MATKVKLNIPGFKALRHAPGVVADLEARADAVADAATDSTEHPVEFVTGSRPGKNRHRTSVVTGNAVAMAVNQKHNTLIKALEAGRG